MSSPLIERLQHTLQYPVLDAASLPSFLAEHEYSVLFFTEDANRFPETNDVAVVLPELVKAFQNKFQPALIAQTDEKKLQSLYGFQAWPALVFMNRQQYLGAITGIQDWQVYLEEIRTLLSAKPKRPLSIGIPVVSH